MNARTAVLLAFGAGIAAAHGLGLAPAVGAPPPAGFADVIARADASVAHVTTVLEGERPAASRDDAVGAGFVLSPDGLVVTSRHTIQGAREVRVALAGRGVLPAQVIGTDDVTDVALLRVGAQGLVPLPIGDPRRLRKGEWVLAAGSPFDLPRSWSVGIVSALGRAGLGIGLRGYEDFIQTDAASNVGNSGGPLLNARGELVGMMTAILSRTGRSEGVSLAVPVDVVLAAAERLRSGTPARRPTMGVIVRPAALGGAGGGGLTVTRFQPGSTGRASGLAVGDLIVEVDGIPTAQVADLQRAVWRHRAGETVSVVVVRGSRRVRFAVRLQ